MDKYKKILPDPLVIAIAFLTRLPIFHLLPSQQQVAWTDKNQGRSLLYYPLVGALLGLLLIIWVMLLPEYFSALLSASLIVCAWVLLTGALHLDGLADSIDAACAAHGTIDSNASAEKILQVFKDPAAGPMAVVSVFMVLLLKIVLLAELLATSADRIWLILVTVLVLARLQIIPLFLTTPYLRSVGTGAALANELPRRSACLVMIFTLLCLFLILPVMQVLTLLLILVLILFFWRRFWVNKLGGFVGDCAGALIELSEVALLLVLFCYQ